LLEYLLLLATYIKEIFIIGSYALAFLFYVEKINGKM
jgi:hypothetical protein